MQRTLAPLFVCLSGLEATMNASGTMVFADTNEDDQLALVDILDHVLNQGVILRGNLVISLAGVDLVYVGLDVILTSIETAVRHINAVSRVTDKTS